MQFLKPRGNSRAKGEPTVEERLQAMMDRTPEEVAADRARLFAAARKARPLPPGKTLEDVVVGAIPGEETEEEIRAALEELS
jgi:hypothetical protein